MTKSMFRMKLFSYNMSYILANKMSIKQRLLNMNTGSYSYVSKQHLIKKKFVFVFLLVLCIIVCS